MQTLLVRFVATTLLCLIASGGQAANHHGVDSRTTSTLALIAPTSGTAHSVPGANPWNMGREPADWRAEVERYHGHVGPWNVIGWRMGKAALKAYGAQWGDHTLDIRCHLPLATPFTCLADGMVVGTGNSIGRLDIGLVDEPNTHALRVVVRPVTGPDNPRPRKMLVLRPNALLMQRMLYSPPSDMAALVETLDFAPDDGIFTVETLDLPAETSAKP